MNRYILLAAILLLTGSTLHAQKKLYGVPENFQQPIDIYGDARNVNEVRVKEYYTKTFNKSNDSPWMVFSDRENNVVYKSANTRSDEVGTINFREYFFVVDEKEKWIKIAKADEINKLKANTITPVGWIQKEKMLLWSTGLVDPKTKINRKAFLLNRADDVKNVLKDKKDKRELIVDFYRDPIEQTKEKEKSIYTRYFVFKKENGKMLLAQEADLTKLNYRTSLLGWVDSRRIKEWNTRISLEPNFESLPFNERKNNRNFHCRAFGDAFDVKRYAENGDLSGMYWDNDPVKLKEGELVVEDERNRFKADVLRFPMFKKSEYHGNEFFESGVIGSIKVLENDGGLGFQANNIPEIAWAEMKDKVGDLRARSESVNLFFLIEATDRTHAFKQSIVRSIRSLRSSKELVNKGVKYGALIYRDIPEAGRVTDFKRLSGDLDGTARFVEQADFLNKIDQDDYTVFYHGLRQSLQVAGFEKDAVNIIVMIGACGDFKINKERKEQAARSHPEYLLEDKEQIFKDLSSMSIHLHGIQVYNNGLRNGRAYPIQLQGFILETAKFIYTKDAAKYRNILSSLQSKSNFQFVQPTMETPVGVTSVALAGSKPGLIILPPSNQSLSEMTFSNGLNDMIKKSVEYEDGLISAFDRMGSGEKLDVEEFSKEAGLSIAGFSSGILQYLGELSEDVDDKYVKDFTDSKLSLYAEVALPIKPSRADYPSYSYVLFMPQTDLLNYKATLKRWVVQAMDGTYAEKRSSLFNVYVSIVEQFASQEILKSKKPEELTRKEVIEIMQGIAGEGLDLSVEFEDLKIGDIRDEKKVKNKQVDVLIARFVKVQEELDRITRLNTRYDFCMNSGGINYYWLRLEQVF